MRDNPITCTKLPSPHLWGEVAGDEVKGRWGDTLSRVENSRQAPHPLFEGLPPASGEKRLCQGKPS